MSIKGTFKAECPFCGERFETDMWTVIRGDRDRTLKEAIMGGEYDLLLCPSCSRMFSCEETFVYMDPGMEIMAFVMPEARPEERAKLLEKMRQDHEALRKSLSGETGLDCPPLYYFGVGALSDLLRRDRDIEEETDVMLFMAGERGFKSAPVRAAFAREKDIPFSMPYAGRPCRDHAVKAVRAILSDNDALLRVKNLLEILEKTGTQELAFIAPEGGRDNRKHEG